jgi:rhomboid family GlyGly-CTERM serine protease
MCAILALCSGAAWRLPKELLDWQPALALAQPWRALSAAFVHYSKLHLGANLAGLALVALLGRRAGCAREDTWAWLAAWPLLHLGLLLQPALLHYGGLSGLLHAGVAVAAVRLLCSDRGWRRGIGAALLAGLLAKVLLESPWDGATRQVAGWDIAIAPLAHATGLLAGVASAWLLHAVLLPMRESRARN